MENGLEFQKLSAKNKFVIINNVKIELPTWILNRYSSLRFLSNINTLQVKCYKCNLWYDIGKYSQDGWIDIHKDLEIKLHKSGFSSYCKICNFEKDKPKILIPFPVSTMERDTIFLTAENLKYVKLRLAVTDMRKADFYNYLVEQEKKLNPIVKFL